MLFYASFKKLNFTNAITINITIEIIEGPLTNIHKIHLDFPVTFAINIKQIAGRAMITARIDRFSMRDLFRD